MKKITLLSAFMAFCAVSFAQVWSTNPNPLTTPAPNNTDNAVCLTDGQERITVLPNGQIGMGNQLPGARLEVKYCPNAMANQPGLLVNRFECVNMGTSLNPVINMPAYGNDGILTPTEPQNFTVAAGSYTIVPITNTNVQLTTVENPMFWVRSEQMGSNMTPSLPYNTFETKFIVMPSGNTGVNTSNPRAALDVRVLNEVNKPAAIFGSIAPTTYVAGTGNVAQYKTQHLQFVPRLAADAFNKIVVGGDQGLFFTDGRGTEGANSRGALVIAPWVNPSQAGTAGGMRMDSMGNVEIHGKLKTIKINVNAKWWADTVFSANYSLKPLSEVESYIRLNKSLPDVPKENTVLSQGIDVADMLAIQMKKTEELTLYLIQMQKKIDELNATIAELKTKTE